MKAVAAVSVMLVLAGSAPFVAAQQACRIERVTYRVQGLQIVSWIMKPASEGRFPVVVWNHGAKFADPLSPIIKEDSPCLPFVSSGWMIFFAQTRGYGGSEGPNPLQTFLQDPMAFLHRRADDVDAGAEWLGTRPDVSPNCIASMGWSQGGLTALLASGKKPQLFRATIVDAPGAVLDTALPVGIGMDDMIRAGKNIPAPILVQTNTTDALVLVEGTRVLVRELRRWGTAVEYKEYTHPSGHQLFNLLGSPAFFQIWGADATRFLEGTFASCAR